MKNLEKIVKSVKEFGRAALFVGTMAAVPFFAGCNENLSTKEEEKKPYVKPPVVKEEVSRPKNKSPVILPIPDQTFEEGSRLYLDLSKYISDDFFDFLNVRLISGPGELESHGGRNDYSYCYEDERDEDAVDAKYVVRFIVTDGRGGGAYGSFNITQRDNWSILPPDPLLLKTERLSSGIEALLIDATSGYISRRHRPQSAIGVDSNGNPIIIYYSANCQPRNRELDAEGKVRISTIDEGTWEERKASHSHLCAAKLGEAGWSREVIGRGQGYISIAIDSSDVAHVCYSADRSWWSSGFEHLHYANNKDGAWNSELICSMPSVGLECDIALDSKGYAHISHWSWSEEKLLYTTNLSGEWSTYLLAESFWQQTSIAVSKDDKVHILHSGDRYFEGSGEGDNFYVQSQGKAEFQREIPKSVMDIDSEGKIHAVGGGEYWVPMLHYATFKDGTWDSEKIAKLDVCPSSRISLAVGKESYIDVVCTATTERSDSNSGMLYFSTNRTGKWQTTILDDRLCYGNPSIAVDYAGKPHISTLFVSEEGGVIKYITFDPDKLKSKTLKIPSQTHSAR